MGHLSVLLIVLMYALCLPLTEVCANFQKISREDFACNNSRYVSVNRLCDGVDHCGDRSDELSCFDCNTGLFHCVTAASCIHTDRICDGEPDCPDGADEQLDKCTNLPKTKVCSKSEFTCASGQCVPSSWRCDHSNDCHDGSDERDCDLNECDHENGGCSHLCVDLPLGFRCDCPSGMRLVQDTHCEDVDHCLDSDVCDQICIFSNESLACECQDGYDLTPLTGQCKATGGVAHMVVCTSKGISWVNLSGSEERNIMTRVMTGSPGPIAAHGAKNELYWVSQEDDIIYRMSVDHSPSVLINASIGILGLAVDEIHERLYWVSTSTRSLHVTSLNGSDQKQLISGLSRPTAVAVQPLLGHLFWANSGTSPKIERARLDGHCRTALITSSIRHPVAISLDIPRGLLYWADSGLHTISRVTYDGKHRKTVIESNGYLDRPFGLAVFESRVYWSDQFTNSTCSANKHNGNELQVSQKLSSLLPAGLAIFHPSLSPADKDLHMSETRALMSDSPFAWILSLTVFLSLLLVGAVLCWRRSKFSGPRSLSLIGHVSLKESQDPLLLAGPPEVHEHKDGTQAGSTQ